MITYTYRDILTQRISQIGCDYEDGDNYNAGSRNDPMTLFCAGRLMMATVLWYQLRLFPVLNTPPVTRIFIALTRTIYHQF
jgi:hypothetical protein